MKQKTLFRFESKGVYWLGDIVVEYKDVIDNAARKYLRKIDGGDEDRSSFTRCVNRALRNFFGFTKIIEDNQRGDIYQVTNEIKFTSFIMNYSEYFEITKYENL